MQTFKRILAICVLSISAVPAVWAGTEGRQQASDMRHEVRLGLGDMAFETLIWHDGLQRDYSYTPHFSAEYSYHIYDWLSVGAIIDFQNTSWTDMDDDIGNFYNLTVLPTVRFNYLRKAHFGVYSAVSFGMDINGGSEIDGFGKYTVACMAADIRFVGVRAGNGPWWGFAELGALAALQNSNIIYMLGSELLRIGVSYKF